MESEDLIIIDEWVPSANSSYSELNSSIVKEESLEFDQTFPISPTQNKMGQESSTEQATVPVEVENMDVDQQNSNDTLNETQPFDVQTQPFDSQISLESQGFDVQDINRSRDKDEQGSSADTSGRNSIERDKTNQDIDSIKHNNKTSTQVEKDNSINDILFIEFSDEKFVCTKCNFREKMPSLFKQHLEKHNISESFSCMHCPSISMNAALIQDHIKEKHTDKTLKYTELGPLKIKELLSTLQRQAAKCQSENVMGNSDSSTCENEQQSSSSPEDNTPKCLETKDRDNETIGNDKQNKSDSIPPNTKENTEETVEPILIDEEDSDDDIAITKTEQPKTKPNALPPRKSRLECSFSSGFYCCVRCDYKTTDEEAFSEHVAVHLHSNDDDTKKLCPMAACNEIANRSKCLLVRNMMSLLITQRKKWLDGQEKAGDQPLHSSGPVDVQKEIDVPACSTDDNDSQQKKQRLVSTAAHQASQQEPTIVAENLDEQTPRTSLTTSAPISTSTTTTESANTLALSGSKESSTANSTIEPDSILQSILGSPDAVDSGKSTSNINPGARVGQHQRNVPKKSSYVSIIQKSPNAKSPTRISVSNQIAVSVPNVSSSQTGNISQNLTTTIVSNQLLQNQPQGTRMGTPIQNVSMQQPHMFMTGPVGQQAPLHVTIQGASIMQQAPVQVTLPALSVRQQAPVLSALPASSVRQQAPVLGTLPASSLRQQAPVLSALPASSLRQQAPVHSALPASSVRQQAPVHSALPASSLRQQAPVHSALPASSVRQQDPVHLTVQTPSLTGPVRQHRSLQAKYIFPVEKQQTAVSGPPPGAPSEQRIAPLVIQSATNVVGRVSMVTPGSFLQAPVTPTSTAGKQVQIMTPTGPILGTVIGALGAPVVQALQQLTSHSQIVAPQSVALRTSPVQRPTASHTSTNSTPHLHSLVTSGNAPQPTKYQSVRPAPALPEMFMQTAQTSTAVTSMSDPIIISPISEERVDSVNPSVADTILPTPGQVSNTGECLPPVSPIDHPTYNTPQIISSKSSQTPVPVPSSSNVTITTASIVSTISTSSRASSVSAESIVTGSSSIPTSISASIGTEMATTTTTSSSGFKPDLPTKIATPDKDSTVGDRLLPNTSEISTSASAGPSASSVSGPQDKSEKKSYKAAFKDGSYICYNCNFKTTVKKTIRKHLWRDLHPKNKCKHTQEKDKLEHCELLGLLMSLVERGKENSQTDITQDKNESPADQEAQKTTNENPENNKTALTETVVETNTEKSLETLKNLALSMEQDLAASVSETPPNTSTGKDKSPKLQENEGVLVTENAGYKNQESNMGPSSRMNTPVTMNSEEELNVEGDEVVDEEEEMEVDTAVVDTDTKLTESQPTEQTEGMEQFASIQIQNVVGGINAEDAPAAPLEMPVRRQRRYQFVCAFVQCNGLSTDSDTAFKLHCLTEHHKEDTLPCAFCEGAYVNEDYLIKHIRNKHCQDLNHTYRCTANRCDYSTNIVKDLERHILSVHKEKDGLACSYCDQTYSSCSQLVRHLRDSVTKVVKCPICGIRSETKQSIIEHIHSTHPTMPAQTLVEVAAACVGPIKPVASTASESLFRLHHIGLETGPSKSSTEKQSSSKPTPEKPRASILRRGSDSRSKQSYVCACGLNFHAVTLYEVHTHTCPTHKAAVEKETRPNMSPERTDVRSSDKQHHGLGSATDVHVPGAENSPQLSNGSNLRLTGSPKLSGVQRSTSSPMQNSGMMPNSSMTHIPRQKKRLLEMLEKDMNLTKCHCNYMTCFKILMKEHENIHSKKSDDSKPFKCQHCPFGTESLHKYQLHFLCHEGRKVLKLYNCSVCQLSSNNEDFMMDHLFDAHPQHDMNYECKLKRLDLTQCVACEDQFASELGLLEHTAAVHGDEKVAAYVKDLYDYEIKEPEDTDIPPNEPVRMSPRHGMGVMSPSSRTPPVQALGMMSPRSERVNAALLNTVNSSQSIPAEFSDSSEHVSPAVENNVLLTSSYASQSLSGNIDDSPAYIPGTQVAAETEEGIVDGSLGCGYCNYSSNDLEMWKKHQVKHIGEGSMTFSVYFCVVCDWPATEKKKMIDHCIKEHLMAVSRAKEQGYEIRNCELHGSRQNSEERDESDHNDEDAWELPDSIAGTICSHHCDFCEFSTNERTLLDNHLAECHNISGYTQPITVGLTDSPEPRREHTIHIQKGESRFVCKVCPYVTDKSKHFKNHIKTHEKQSKILDGYKCPYCVQVFTTHGNARAHHNRYHSEQSFDLIRVIDGEPQIRLQPHEIVPQTTATQSSATQQNTPIMSNLLNHTKHIPTSLPRALHQAYLSLDFPIPDENIFREAVKCPKCNESFKVRMLLLRHLSKHENIKKTPTTELQERDDDPVTSGKGEEPMDLQEADNESDNDNVPDNVSEQDEDVEDQDESEEEDDVEDKDVEEEVTKTKPKIPESQDKYCTKVAGMDLHQCTKCVFMHKFPSKVLRHFRYKHEKFCPYQCGYCSFVAVESPKVRRHCVKKHRDQPVKIIDTSTQDVADKVSEAEDKQSVNQSETAGNTVNSEGNDISERTVDRAERAAAQGVQEELENIVKRYIIKGAANIQTCLICGYRQEGASSLKRHLFAIHLNYHPYKCKYCDFKAVERNKVIKHLEKSHEGLKMKIVRIKYRGTLPEVETVPTPDIGVNDTGTIVDGMPAVLGTGEWGQESDRDLNHQASTGLLISSVASVTGGDESTEMNENSREPSMTSDTCAQPEPIVGADVSQSGSEYGALSEESQDTMTPICIKPEPGYSTGEYGQMPEGMFFTEDDQMLVPQHSLRHSSDTMGAPVTPVRSTVQSTVAKKTPPPYKGYKDGSGVLKRCKYCSYKTVWNLGDVKTHVLVTHLKKMPYGCKFCGHSSRDKRRLKEHCKTHGKTSMPGFRYMYNDYTDVMEITRGAAEVMVGIKSCETDEDLARAARMTKIELEQMALEFDTAEAEERAVMALPTGKNSNKPAVEIQNEPLDLSSPGQPAMLGVISPANSSDDMHQMMKSIQKRFSPTTSSLASPSSNTENQSITKLTERHIQCIHCGYVHFDRYKIKIHCLAKHLGLKPYMCSICNFGDFIFHRVRDHVKDAHPDANAILRRCINEKEAELKKMIVGADLRKMQAKFPIPRVPSNNFKPWGCGHCRQYKAYSKAKIRYHSIARHKGMPFKYIQYERPRASSALLASDKLAALAAKQEGPAETNSRSSSHLPMLADGAVKCPHCSLTLMSREQLASHIRINHANIGIFQCPYCPSRIRYKAKMKLHQLRKHTGLPVKFNLVHLKENSKLTVTGQNGNVQNRGIGGEDKKPHLVVPDWRTKLQQRRSDIMIDHYTCKACTFVTKDQFAMRNHAQGHINYRPYRCPYCTYGNVKSFPIKLHVAKHHPSLPVRFQLAKDATKELELRELYTRPLNITKKMPAVHIPLDQLAKMPEEQLAKFGEGTAGFLAVGLSSEGNEAPPVPIQPKQEVIDPSEQSETSSIHPAKSPSVAGVDAKNITQPRSKGPVGNRPYCCKLCGHWSQNHTAIKRHLMWELRYLPYHCQHCIYKDVHGSGIESHCERKHHGKQSHPVIRRNTQRENHIQELIEQSRVRPTRPAVLPFISPPKDSLNQSMEIDIKPEITHQPPMLQPAASVKQPSMPANELTELLSEGGQMPVRLLKCRLCGFASQKAKTLLNHWVRHGPKRFQCQYCTFSGHYPYEIVKHCQKFHPKRNEGHRALKFERRSMKEDMEVLTGEAARTEVERQIAQMTMQTQTASMVMSGDLDQGNYLFKTSGKETPKFSTNQKSFALKKVNQCIIDGLIIPEEELEKDESGAYKCRYCSYSNMAKEHYKNHLVRHTRPRWKCAYCKTKNQLSYDLMKHVRKTHPNRPPRVIKINPEDEGSKIDFSGRLMIDGTPLRLKEVNPDEMQWGDGIVLNSDNTPDFDSDGGRPPKSSSKEAPKSSPAQVATPISNAGNLQLNCNQCAFSTRNTMIYIEHLKSHQPGDDDAASVTTEEGSNSRAMTPQPLHPGGPVPLNAEGEQFRKKLLRDRGELRINVSDILLWSQASMESLLAEHGLSTLSVPKDFFSTSFS